MNTKPSSQVYWSKANIQSVVSGVNTPEGTKIYLQVNIWWIPQSLALHGYLPYPTAFTSSPNALLSMKIYILSAAVPNLE